MNEQTTPISVFQAQASNGLKDQLRVYPITRDSEYADALEFVSFTRPTDVMVSRWYPGYRVTDLTGKQAEEGIGLMLANTLTTIEALENFRRLLATPDLASEIITTLLPRANVAVRGRQYLMSEELVGKTTSEIMDRRGWTVPELQAAYSHAITRVLSSLELVQPGVDKRVVNVAPTYAVSAEDISRIILIESMRDVFSDARLSAATRELKQDATPQIIGETVGRMFRTISHVIPEIKLRLEELETVIIMIALYNINPTVVPNALQAHPALITLASLANFVVYARERSVVGIRPPAAAIAEIKEACNNILSVVQSAPSIELVPLSRYAEHFGEVPVTSPAGIRRGLVVYASMAQTSKMEVADVRPVSSGFELALLSPEYVRASSIAAPVTGTLLAPEAMAGLANIAADELGLRDAVPGLDEDSDPKLLTIQVTNEDLTYIAMAKAEAVAYVKAASDLDVGPTQPGIPLKLLFGCTVAESWRMSVMAATPAMAFFLDPAAVVMYKSDMLARLPKPIPARSQVFGLSASTDIVFANIKETNADTYLVRSIEKPFRLKLPVQTYGGSAIVLELDIMPLAGLLGYDVTKYPERGTAFYAAVREPGVDREINLMLKLALAFADGGGDIIGDRAKSWIIERLAPALTHPAVQQMAERAINASVIKQGLDARSLAPQFKEVVVRSYFGTLMAILSRFDKVEGDVAVELTNVVPVTGLSIKSQLTLATLPNMLNASSLTTR